MGKGDFIDKIVGGIEKLFLLAHKDIKSFILVLSIGANVYLGHKVIKTNEEMRDAIVEEVRKQVPREVRKETAEQLIGVAKKVDTVLNQSREFYNTLKKIKDDE